MCETFDLIIFNTRLGNLLTKLKTEVFLESQSENSSYIRFLPSTKEGKEIYNIILILFTFVFKRSLGGFVGKEQSKIIRKLITSGIDFSAFTKS